MRHDTILDKSSALFQKANQWIPGGVNSPVRAFKSVGGIPRFIASAKGAYVVDVDEKAYIDYVGSWGPMILGHANEAVIHAIQSAAEKGLSFGAPCEQEIKLAELICHRVNLEKIRFVNSGTEATMTAIRLARGITARSKIIKFKGCYHGHVDSLLIKAGSGALTLGVPDSAGVPQAVIQDTLIAAFNDLDSIASLFKKNPNDIACVILEPIAGNMNMVLPKPGFLEGLRALCDRYQSLLIFDEVMTGFRVGYQGMQSLTSVKPDLTTYGKIIGGGMPVGAVAGSTEYLSHLAPSGAVYQAGTLSGNPLAMAAGIATLSQLKPAHYDGLTQRANQLITGLKEIAKSHRISFTGHYQGGMFGFFFTEKEVIESYDDVMSGDVKRFNQFFHGMLDAGVYFAPSAFEAGFISIAHEEQHIHQTLMKAQAVFASFSQ